MKPIVYLYAANNLNFRRQLLHGLGVHAELDKQIMTGWHVSENHVPLAPLFTKIILALEEAQVTDVIFNVPPALESLIKILRSPNVEETAKTITKRLEPGLVREDLLQVCDVLQHTSVKHTFRKYSVEKEDFIGDVRADAACDCGMTQFGLGSTEPELKIEDEKLFRKKVSSLHPMMFDNNVVDIGVGGNVAYFSGTGDMTKRAPKKDKTKETDRIDASHVYFIGNNGRLRNYGMYTALERYHVLIPKENDEYIDTVIDHQRKIVSNLIKYPVGSVIRLKECASPSVNSHISSGDFSRIGISPEGDMYNNGGKRSDMSYVFNPPRLFYKVKSTYMAAYEQLKGALYVLEHGKPVDGNYIDASANVYLTDVTDSFYTEVDGKLAMNPDRNVKEQHTKFEDVVYDEGKFNVKMMYQISMPTYQEFKRLVKLNPKIYIATDRKEAHVISLSMIIVTDAGACRYNSPDGGVKVLRKASKTSRK